MRKFAFLRKVVLLVVAFIGVSGLSSCCLIFYIFCGYSSPHLISPTKPGLPGTDHQPTKQITKAKQLRRQASGPTQATLAPFYGNLSAVTAPTSATFLLVRQPDCSLGYGTFFLTGSGTAPIANVTAMVPHYEQVIHNSAFLTTTPSVYAKGCATAAPGEGSGLLAYLGQAKNGDYLGAALITGTTIYTYSVSSTYAITVGTTLTTDIDSYVIIGGDLNNDGNIDLISTNTDGINSSVSVFISNGDGTYKAAVNYELPNTVITFGAVDDLNGDGNLDLLVNAENGGFMVFLGKGDGTFAAPVSVNTGGQSTFFMDKFITADVNGDKKKDIITAAGQIFLGAGDGVTFTSMGSGFPPVLNPSNGLAPGIVAADFNNDGKIDLATDDGATIRTYLGNGTGSFTAGPAYATIANRGLIVASDIDGDGNLDMYSGYAGTPAYGTDDYLPNTGYALLGNGDGTFAGAPYLPVTYTGTNLADLNGDGRPDLVGFTLNSNNQGTLTSYLTQSNGFPIQGPQLVLPVGQTGGTPVVGKFVGNATIDLFWVGSTPNGPNFNLAVGNGDGSFQLPTTFAAPSLVPPGGQDVQEDIQGAQTVDINHDGKADLIYTFFDIDSATGTYYTGFAVQLGNGDGTFQTPKITYTLSTQTQTFDAGTSPFAAIYDVNKDNFPDLFLVTPGPVVNGTRQNTLQEFLSNGDGTFQTPTTITVTGNILESDAGYGSPLAFADLNGDGNVDLVTSGSSSDGTTPTIAIALGNGNGTFKAPTLFTLEGFGYAGEPTLANYTGSGKMDLALAGSMEGSGGIFPGNGDGTFQSIANGDGTISPTQSIALAVSGAAVAADFNGDGKMDVMFGSVILLNKEGATPPVLAATSTALASSLNPSTSGANVTFTATVTSATAGTITGPVNFFDGATQIGSGTLTDGVATFATSTLSVATHSITAQYGGDTNYMTSTSPIVSQVVNAAGGKAETTTVVVSSLNPSTSGTSVMFSAAVSSATAGTITGTATFLDGATAIGTGTLTGGMATYSTSTLAVGAHSITAQYGGDSNYATSTSTAITQTVNAAQTGDFSVAASPTSLTIAAGQTGNVGLSVMPLNGSTQTVTFTCGGLPAATACSFLPASTTLDGTHTATTQVMITTTARNPAVRAAAGAGGNLPGAGRALGILTIAFVGIFGLSFLRPRNRVWRTALVLAILAVPAMALMSCSGSPTMSGGGTPAGTYTLTISGTAGTDSHGAPVTLTVN